MANIVTVIVLILYNVHAEIKTECMVIDYYEVDICKKDEEKKMFDTEIRIY